MFHPQLRSSKKNYKRQFCKLQKKINVFTALHKFQTNNCHSSLAKNSQKKIDYYKLKLFNFYDNQLKFLVNYIILYSKRIKRQKKFLRHISKRNKMFWELRKDKYWNWFSDLEIKEIIVNGEQHAHQMLAEKRADYKQCTKFLMFVKKYSKKRLIFLGLLSV